MKKIFSTLLIICMIISTFSVGFALESVVGSGSNNPFIISSKAEFFEFVDKANSSTDGLEGQYYLLTADIDFEDENLDAYGIGSESNPFKGHLDGNGHTISNYKFTYKNAKLYRGLFNVIGGNATIKNLGVKNASYETAGWTLSFGGLVGYMLDSAEITGCFSKNTTIITPDSGGPYVSAGGGLIGRIESDNAYVTNCYSLGTTYNISHVDCDGGLIGYAGMVGGITRCFTDTFLVRVSDTYPSAVTKCYYVQTAPWPYAAGSWGFGCYPGTQVSEEELKAVPDALSGVYKIGGNNSYPCFLWESYNYNFEGVGTMENPYLIKTADDLKAISGMGEAEYLYFRLENDIDVGGDNWRDYIGSEDAPFKGNFDGNGHVISNYNIVMGEKPRGIFAVVGGNAIIRNLGVSDVKFSHDTWRLEAGGIVGRLTDNATVTGCFAKNMTVERTGSNTSTEAYAVGGLVGKIDGEGTTLENSYAFNCSFVGGYVDHDGSLVGIVSSYKTIRNCYTNGNTMRFTLSDDSGVSNVYYLGATTWPNQWNGTNNGYIGTVLSEAELKASTSLLGIAFADDPAEELINGGYPILAWEDGSELLAFSGDGSKNNPYILSTIKHLCYVAEMSTTKGKYFKLTSDIDFEGNTLVELIGTDKKPFEGIFDGNGHVIRNIDTTVYTGNIRYGLFGAVGGNAIIRNIGIENATFTAGHAAYEAVVGGLIGELKDNALVENCFAKNVTLYSPTKGTVIRRGGGLIGSVSSAAATVRNCYAQGNYMKHDKDENGTMLSGEIDYDGGLIGAILEAATVENCYSSTNLLRCNTSVAYNIINCYAIDLSTWAGVGQAYFGTKITESALKSTGASKLGDAFETDVEPYINNGFPVLTWEVSGYLLGEGTVSDPYLIRNANDLKLVADIADTTNLYFKLTDDIDLSGKKWITSIGTSNAFFKGYFDGNGKVVKNFVIDVNDDTSYGLFGAMGGNAHIYSLGVENVKVNANVDGGTVGGLVGSVYDNGKITGCFAKNVEFSTSDNMINYGGGLAGRIYASGAEIKSCYTKGTTGLENVNFDGGFAGVAELYTYFEDCYSDTTLTRVLDGFVVTNSYCTQNATENSDGYVWCGTVKNVNELDYDWSNDFVPSLYGGPTLKWENYKGYYVNMIPNSAMDTTDPDSLFNTVDAEVVTGYYSGRNSDVLKLPRDTTFKYDLDMERDSCYRVSFLARTQGGVQSTDMEVYLGTINLSEQFVADKITDTWTKKVIYVKPQKTGVNRLAIGAVSAIYLDNVEVELINQSAELAEISATLVHEQPESAVTYFQVMPEICDGVEVVYTNNDNYIDGSGKLIKANIPKGEGVVETDYTATVFVGDKSISKTVTLSIEKEPLINIDSVELLKSDSTAAETALEAVKVGMVTVSIEPETSVDLVVALYYNEKLIGMKQKTVSKSGDCDFDMDATDADCIKVFIVEKGTLRPLTTNLIY